MDEVTQYRFDIFISYSHSDIDWVQNELIPRFDQQKIKVCIDYRDFEIGMPTEINIEDAINDSRFTIIVLSEDWCNSEWTKFESQLALHKDISGLKKKIIPILLKPCTPPNYIKRLNYVDLQHPSQYDIQFNRLINQILKRLASNGKVSSTTNRNFSPFIAGPPIVHPFCFFGRNKLLRRIFGLLNRFPMHNIAINGPRRSGKTSLLQYVQNITKSNEGELRSNQKKDWLDSQESYCWIFVDFQDIRFKTRDGFLKYLLRQLCMPIPSETCTIENFMETVSYNIKSPTVILLDEIEVALVKYKELDDEFWDSIRSLTTLKVFGNVGFILASNGEVHKLAKHNGLSSSFFNTFGITSILGPIEREEALELIYSSPVSFSQSDIDWILEKSGCWPLLLQILSYELFFHLEKGDKSQSWKLEALRQMEPFKYLMEI